MNTVFSIKGWLKVVFGLLIVLLITLFSIPFFFKDAIVEKVEAEANKYLNAELRIADANLSLFPHFPDFTLALSGFELIGKEPFEGIPLLRIADFSITLDLLSVIFSDQPFLIKAIDLEAPRFDIRILKNGLANYDIVKTDSTLTEEKAQNDQPADFLVSLERFNLVKADLIYKDYSSSVFLEIVDLSNKSKAFLTPVQYDLQSLTTISSFSFSTGGTEFFSDASLSLTADFGIDTEQMNIDFKAVTASLNDLQIALSGNMQYVENDLSINLSFSTPQNQFKDLLSIIPGAYIKEFDQVKTTGSFSLDGKIQGVYGFSSGQLPAFDIAAAIQQGGFTYPGLPMGMEQINAAMQVKSDGTDMDKMEVVVEQFSFLLGNNTFALDFMLKTPVSDPYVDANMRGKIDLANIYKAFPLSGITSLSGIIDADVHLKTNYSILASGDYDNALVEGNIGLSGLELGVDNYPEIRIDNSTVNFTPRYISISESKMVLGRSDVRFEGKVDNALAWFSPEKTTGVNLTFSSKLIDANEWIIEESTEVETQQARSPADMSTGEEYFDRYEISVKGEIGSLLYEDYQLNNMLINGLFSPNKLIINSFKANMGESDLVAKGEMYDLMDYVYGKGILSGQLDIYSRFLDLNPFMESSADSPDNETEVAFEPFGIPADMSLTIQTKMDKVIYTNMNLTDLSGTISIAEITAALKNVSAKTMGGIISFDGAYNTTDPENPVFNMATAIKEMGFKNAYNTFNTFKAAAPIGAFLDGTFSTDLSFSGQLGKDLSPVYESINATGFIETINSAIKNYKPLQELSKQFNMPEFNQFNIENTKNWFEIKDGRVIVEPFDTKVKDIPLNISGSHLLSGGMDYQIKVNLPAKYTTGGAIGTVVQSAIGTLKNEAQKLGLPFKEPAFYNFHVSLSGTLADPKVGIRFTGTDGEKKVGDVAKEKVTETVKELKDTIRKEAEQKIKETKEEAAKKAEEMRRKIEEDAKKRAEEAKKKLEAEKKKAEEEAKKKAEELKKKLEEEAKRKLEDLNPLKKKGGGNE